jgi:hypothetical protein
MSDLNLNRLISQVKINCNLSDAKYWGNYSICGLLLRLRELYRMENRIMPWEQLINKDVATWISNRENLWHEIEDEDFIKLSIGEKEYSPFNMKNINKSPEESGIIYGGGIGMNNKPSFFLAELHSIEVIEGYKTYISGNEYARDLSVHPAMLQGNIIFARRNALSTLLWDKFEEKALKRHGGAISYAFSYYKIYEDTVSENVYSKILEITENELETYIYHEIGEAFEGKRLGRDWKRMLSKIQNRRVEFFVRGIKDVLSDTSETGMLKNIIENDKKGSMGFYISFLEGFRKLIFPELLNAFKNFAETGNWTLIEKARNEGYNRAEKLASRVLDIFNRQKDKTKISETIEKELLSSKTLRY